MNQRHTYRIKILILGVAFSTPQFSWSQYLRNGTLDGELGDRFPPNFWYTDDEYSDPDLMAVYTTNTSTRSYFPVDGTNFALLRARGIHYSENHHGRRQRENLYQPLAIPLEKKTCFLFTAWLCTNPDYRVEDTENPNAGFPLRFQLWGSNRPGGRDTLLVDSDPISNTDWENYSFIFSTSESSIAYLLFEPQWDTINVKPEPYNGMILVDLLNLIKLGSGSIDTLNEYTVYYHGDNQDTLTASNGDSYLWSPGEYLSSPDRQSVVVRSFTETVSVRVQPKDECPFYDLYHLILNCDTLYPRDTNRIVDHYYKYEKNIVLEASEGSAYNWEPKVNLSAYDVRAPYMTAYQDHYTVFITSKYNCPFMEYFNIILSCDTLYPDKTIIAIDTLLLPGSSIILTPRHGIPNESWQPQKYLSCMNCWYPLATPQSTITYSVSLTDEYGCVHTEVFIIGIELQIPNTITPNDDGTNDCLKVFGLPEGSSFKVFDQTGRLIFSKDPYDIDDCWNGVDKQGKPLKADTYWYAFDHPSLGTLSTGFIFIKR
jgi:gliding motility-associated-like protein